MTPKGRESTSLPEVSQSSQKVADILVIQFHNSMSVTPHSEAENFVTLSSSPRGQDVTLKGTHTERINMGN